MLIRVDVGPIQKAAGQAPYFDGTVRQIADRSGVSRSTVHRIFKGDATSVENIGRLALTYGVSLDLCITAEGVAA
jgi:transcriptional regulator with XRE-family HTH domain